MAQTQVDRILQTVREAQRAYAGYSQEQVDRILDAMNEASVPLADQWARLAVEETGFGRVEDKVTKNLFASRDVYRYIRPMQTVGFIEVDAASAIYEVAQPMGIVAAIVPSTNPTSTAIYKTMVSLKARNGVVHSPHPAARRCIAAVVNTLHDAAVKAGAPRGIVGVLEEPTIEDTQALMAHRETNVILATGGMGLVRAAYASGKPAYGVGPGNVPAFIERTATVDKAVRDVIAGKSFDWGTICASEQSVIVDEPVADEARRLFGDHGGYFADDKEKALLEAAMVSPDGHVNPKIVGKSPQAIASLAGFSVPASTRVLLVKMEGVGRDHPLSMEKLSPVLCWYVEDGWEDGCKRCIEILRYGGLGHTLSVHTRDLEVVRQFALHKPAFRIIVNSPSTHGAIGYTTNLPPSMTLGCGALGNNITSDNITPLHLIDRKRIAMETRPLEGETNDPLPPLVSQKDRVASAAKAFVEDRMSRKDVSARTGRAVSAVPAAGGDLPVDFVSEQDVRKAMQEGRKVLIHSGTLLTPLARELGEEHQIFERR